jgi:hypothetical protein
MMQCGTVSVGIHIDLLTDEREEEYEELLLSSEHSLLYASPVYRRFLCRILTNGRDRYLLAFKSGRMVGALPTFLCENRTYGNVLNSLPFYGSHGGIITRPGLSDPYAVKRALIEAFHSLADEESVGASTIISNPFEPDPGFYEDHTKYTLRDERIGQMTSLPSGVTDRAGYDDALMAVFEPKARQNIRRAIKCGVAVYHSESIEALKTLSRMHQENIEAAGGLAKNWEVFAAIRDTFAYERDYRVYLAESDGSPAAGLLVFYYNRTAEYFTPAADPRFRNAQPTSLVILEAMREAVRRGCTTWNWGGTWLTQDGVYRFKARWGTVDYPYFYYIREYGTERRFRELSRATLLNEYPYFYTVPFKYLENTEG